MEHQKEIDKLEKELMDLNQALGQIEQTKMSLVQQAVKKQGVIEYLKEQLSKE
ncbi:MAG: hypothetical protein ABIC57_01950 [bacterium]